ncbi:MAG: DUF4347 domain-containing protein, partial [Burkholderiales bacterium]
MQKKTIAEAVRTMFSRTTTRRRPERQKMQLEPLEPRVLLSAEIPVIPPSSTDDGGAFSAPFEINGAAAQQLLAPTIQWDAAALDAAASQRIVKIEDAWGKRDLAAPERGSITLDFSAVTQNLKITLREDGVIEATDGDNILTAEGVSKIVAGSGADEIAFKTLPSASLHIEADARDTLDFSAIAESLTFTKRVDGTLAISGGESQIETNGTAQIVEGAGSNTHLEERSPVIAGTLTGGVFSAEAAKLTLAQFNTQNAAPRQIVFIDPSVENYQSLLRRALTAGQGNGDVAATAEPLSTERDVRIVGTSNGTGGAASALVSPDALVVVLDAAWDGIAQITEVLAAYQSIAAVHILSHGSPGSARLGNGTLTTARLSSMAESLRAWGRSLAPDADVMVYGCDIAAGDAGMAFIGNLAELTGADVAASINPTGAPSVGGDWVLEASTGVIDTGTVFDAGALAGYGYLLATHAGTAGVDNFQILATSTNQTNNSTAGVDNSFIATGDAGDDTFSIKTMAGTTMTLNGGAGTKDTVDLGGVSGNAVIKLTSATGNATVTVGTTKTITLTGVEVVTANSGGSHTLDLSTFSPSTNLMVKIFGVNKVRVATKTGATWNDIFEASNISEVKGGSGQNIFVIGKGGSLSGGIDGFSANANNILSYSGTFTVAGTSYVSGLEDYPKEIEIKLNSGSNSDGYTSALAFGYLDTFSKIRHFVGGQLGDMLQASDATSGGGTDLIGGKGNDQLISGQDGDTLTGGLGGDTYAFREAVDWVGDSIKEDATGDGQDVLDLSAITTPLTIEVRPNTGAGIKLGTTGVTALDNNVKYIEKILGGSGENVYKFSNDWTQIAADKELVYEIDDSAATADKGTLDFSGFVDDLTFTLETDGAVTAVAKKVVDPNASTLQYKTYKVVGIKIANLIGGAGNNTYVVVNNDALHGTITSKNPGKENILDYSKATGAFYPVVDFSRNLATGINRGPSNSTTPVVNTYAAKQNVVSNSAQGSFSLILGGVATTELIPIVDGNAEATAANIQQALDDMLGAGLAAVKSLSASSWEVDFKGINGAEVPLMTTSTQLTAGSISIAVGSSGAKTDGGGRDNGLVFKNASGLTTGTLAEITRVIGSAQKPVTVVGVPDSNSVSLEGSVFSGVMIAGNNNGTTDPLTMTGGSNADLLIGGSGLQTLYGGGGADYLIAGDGNTTALGGSGNDKLIGGSGNDKLSGGQGNDTLVVGGNQIFIEETRNGSTRTGNLLTVTATAGTYVLSDGTQSATLAFNANAAAIQTALQGFTSIGAGHATVTLKAGTTNKFDIVFQTLPNPPTLYIKANGISKLSGGTGNDVYVVTDDWGQAQVFESEGAGTDSIDFSKVTKSLTYQFNKGVLTVGTGAFTQTVSTLSKLFSTGDVSGTFAAGDQLTVPIVKSSNPTVTLDLGAASTGKFTIKLNATAATASQFASKEIIYNADAKILAAAIKDAIETASKATGTGLKVAVELASDNVFNIEFVKFGSATFLNGLRKSQLDPGFASIATNGLNASGGGAVTPTLSVANGQALKEIQRLVLGNVSGTSSLPTSMRLQIGDTITAVIPIHATNDETTATNIQTALNNLARYKFPMSIIGGKYNTLVTSVGTGSTHAWEIVFLKPDATDVADIKVMKAADVAGKPELLAEGIVSQIQDGGSASKLSNLETLVAADANGNFIFGNGWGTVYSYGQQYLPSFLKDADSTLTIDTATMADNGRDLTLDFRAVSKELKFTFIGHEYSNQQLLLSGQTAPFTLSFSDAEVFKLDFGTTTGKATLKLNPLTGPTTTQLVTDEIEIKIGSDATAAKTATRIQDAINGKLTSFYQIGKETVSVTTVPDEDGVYLVRFLEKGYVSGLAKGTLTGGATLTVSAPLVKAEQTTESITFGASDKETAENIQKALNKLKYAAFSNVQEPTTPDPLKVKVAVGSGGPKQFVVTFDQENTEDVKVKPLKASVGIVKELETTKSTRLEIVKPGKRSSIISGASPVNDVLNAIAPTEVEYNKLVISHVGANTTLYGGGNANTFALTNGAQFAGNLIGGTGLRPPDALSLDTITGMLGLQFPQVAVTNTVDISDNSFKFFPAENWLQPYVLLEALPGDGQIKAQITTVASSGEAAQTIYLPGGANAGTFTLTYDDSSNTPKTTAAIKVEANPDTTAANIKAALEGLPGGIKVTVVKQSTGNAFDISFQKISATNVVKLLVADGALLMKELVYADLDIDRTVVGTAGTAGTKATQKLYINGATGGEFALVAKVATTTGTTTTTASKTTDLIKIETDATKTAENIAAALNSVYGKNKTLINPGAVTVAVTEPGVFTITWIENGAQDKLTPAVVQLKTSVKADPVSTTSIYKSLDVAGLERSYQKLYLPAGVLSGDVKLTVGTAQVTITTTLADTAATLLTQLQTKLPSAQVAEITGEGTDLKPFVLRLVAATGISAIDQASVKFNTDASVALISTTTEGVDADNTNKFKLEFSGAQAGDKFVLSYTQGTTPANAINDIAWDADPEILKQNIRDQFETEKTLFGNDLLRGIELVAGSTGDYLITLAASADATLTRTLQRGSTAVGTATATRIAQIAPGVQQVQEIKHNANNGTFTLTIGEGNDTVTTAAIAFDADAATVKQKLVDARNTNAVKFAKFEIETVEKATTTDPWKITFKDAAARAEITADFSGLKFQADAKAIIPAVKAASGPAQNEVRTLTSKLQTGSFTLSFNGKITPSLAVSSTAAQIESALNALNAGSVTVADATAPAGSVKAWAITFLPASGGATGEGKAQTLTALTPYDLSQKIPGFGRVMHVSNLVYGPGIQAIGGTNIGVAAVQQAAKYHSASGLSNLLGQDSFEIGGGKSLLDKLQDTKAVKKIQDSTAYKALNFFATSDAFGNIAGNLSSELNSLSKGALDLLSLSWNPGIHALSGFTGGDTYKFSGFWGAGIVVEMPEPSYLGLSSGYDTLDFSGVSSDMQIDVWEVTTENHHELSSLLNSYAAGKGIDVPVVSIGTNFVMARDKSLNLAYEVLSSFGEDWRRKIEGTLGLSPGEAPPVGSIVLANDIENIVGGGGNNTITLHDGARIKGTLSAAGSLSLDYSKFGAPLQKQLLAFDNQIGSLVNPLTGSLRLSVVTSNNTVYTTAPISITGSATNDAAAIQAALNASTVLGPNSVTVTAPMFGKGGQTFEIVFNGPGDYRVGVVAPLVIFGTSGSFILTDLEPDEDDVNSTASLPFNADAAKIQEALEKFGNIGVGNVKVSGTAGNFTVTLFNPATAKLSVVKSTSLNDATIAAGTLTLAAAPAGSDYIITDGNAEATINNNEAVKKLKVDGADTDRFVLRDGANVASFLRNAPAATIQTALEGFASIGGVGKVTVTGSDGDYQITYNSPVGTPNLVVATPNKVTFAANATAATVQRELEKFIGVGPGRVTVSGNPGAYTFAFNGLTYNPVLQQVRGTKFYITDGTEVAQLEVSAKAPAIQAALEAFKSIGDGNVKVTDAPSGAFNITFAVSSATPPTLSVISGTGLATGTYVTTDQATGNPSAFTLGGGVSLTKVTGAHVNGSATNGFQVIPPILIPGLGALPSVTWDFASADGVQGGRAGGLTSFIGAFSSSVNQFEQNFAIANLTDLTGSTGNDVIAGGGNDAVFNLSSGGQDQVTGGGDSNTVTYKDSTIGRVFNVGGPAVVTTVVANQGKDQVQLLDFARAVSGTIRLGWEVDPSYNTNLAVTGGVTPSTPNARQLASPVIVFDAADPETTRRNIEAALNQIVLTHTKSNTGGTEYKQPLSTTVTLGPRQNTFEVKFNTALTFPHIFTPTTSGNDNPGLHQYPELEILDQDDYGNGGLEFADDAQDGGVVFLVSDAIQNPSHAVVSDTGLTLTVAGTSGSFTLGTSSTNKTAALNFNATAAEIQTALQALPGIGAGKVLVTATSGGFTISPAGTLAVLPALEAIATSPATATLSIQKTLIIDADGGLFTLSNNTATPQTTNALSYAASASTIQTALRGIGLGGEVRVSEGSAQGRAIARIDNENPSKPALTIAGTAGSFVISDGDDYVALTATASADNIRAALGGFKSIGGAEHVKVTGEAGVFEIEFVDVDAEPSLVIPLSRVLQISLTGGTSNPNLVVNKGTSAAFDSVKLLTTTGGSSSNYFVIRDGTDTAAFKGDINDPTAIEAANAKAVQAALELLPGIGKNNVTVTPGSTAGVFNIAAAGALSQLPALSSASAGVSFNTAGTVLTVSGATEAYKLNSIGISSALSFNANAAAIQTALEATPGVGVGNIVVTAGSTAGTFDIAAAGWFDELPELAIDSGNTLASLSTNGKVLTVTGTSGNFTLSAKSSTAKIALNAKVAELQAALEKFKSIGTGNVTVAKTTGGLEISFQNPDGKPALSLAGTSAATLSGTGATKTLTVPQATGDGAPVGFGEATYVIGDGTETVVLSWNADAAFIRAALAAFESIGGVANVNVTGNAGSYQIVLSGSAATVALTIGDRVTATLADSTTTRQLAVTGSGIDSYEISAGTDKYKFLWNATAATIQTQLRNFAGLTGVTVAGSDGNWQISQASSTPVLSVTPIGIAIKNSAGATLSTAGKLEKTRIAPADLDSGVGRTTAIEDIQAFEGSQGNDLFYGSAGSETFVFHDDWGKDIIVGGIGGFGTAGLDKLDFSKVRSKVNVVLGDNLIYAWSGGTQDNPTNSVIAYGTFEKPYEALSDGEKIAKRLKDAWDKTSSSINSYWTGGDVTTTPGTTLVGTNFSVSPQTPIAANFTAALDAWKTVLGSDSALLEGIQNIRIDVVDLGAVAGLANASGYLARTYVDSSGATPTLTIQIDNNAAGYGWHTSTTSTPTAGTIDLVTVLAHEIGHLLGAEHESGTSNVLSGTLAAGVRNLPTAADNKSDVLAVAKNQLGAGLENFGTWSAKLGTSVGDYLNNAGKLPFSTKTIGNLLGLDVVAYSLGDTVSDGVDSLAHGIMAYLNDPTVVAPTSAGLIAAINANSTLSQKITLNATESNTLTEFNASLIVGSYSKDLDISLDSLSLDFLNDLGLPSIDLGFSIDQSHPLNFNAQLILNFDFGLDSAGKFFVGDPSLNASVSFGDRPLDVASMSNDEINDTTDIVLSGNHVSGTQVGNVNFAAEDRFYLTGVPEEGVHQVVTATFDAATNSTKLKVAGIVPIAESGGVVRKAFDLSASLGPLAIGIEDGVTWLHADASIGVSGRLAIDTMTGDTNGEIFGFPSLNGGIEYEVILPIVPQGALAGLSGGSALITASSGLTPADASLAQVLANIPNTIKLSGFDDLFRFKGVSLDMILTALNAGLDSLVGESPVNEVQRIAYSGNSPFTLTFDGISTASIAVGNSTGATAANIKAALEALSNVDTVSVTWNAAQTGWDVVFLAAGGGNFNVASMSSLTGGVSITDVTQGHDATGKLYSKLPLINKSAAQLFGNSGVDFITEVRDAFKKATAAVTHLDELETAINTELVAIFQSYGLVSPKPVTLQYKNSVFYFNLDLGLEYNTQIPINLSLKDLDPTLASIGDALGLTFEAGGDLDLTARVDLDFGVGFDLRDITQPDLYFEDSTGLELSLDIHNTSPITLKAFVDVPVLGKIGIQAIDGSASLNLAMGFGLRPDGDDGRYNFGELKNAFEVYFRGDAQLDLPLYFPTASLPMGGTTRDLNADGYGDNVLHVGGQLDATLGQGISTNLDVIIPSLVPSIDIFALLNDPETMLKGIDGMFTGIKDGLNSKFASLALPLVGDKLKTAANFVDKLRDSLLGVKTGQGSTSVTAISRYDSGSLGYILADAVAKNNDANTSNDVTVSDLLVDAVAGALYEKLGKPGLNVLRVTQTDSKGRPVFDSATGSPKLLEVTSADQVQISIDGTGLKFNVTLGDSILKYIFPNDNDGTLEFLEYNPIKDAVSIPIDFSAAIPGLSLKTGPDDTIDLRFNYVLGLGFGLSKADGFYLDTSGVTESGDELQIDLTATLSAGASLSATVIVLQGLLQDVDDGRPSGLYGQFSVDLRDSGGNGRYTVFKPSFLGSPISETLSVIAELSAVADVDIKATLAVEPIDASGDHTFSFPNIYTTLHYDQVFAKATFGTGGSSSSFGGKPIIVFEAVTLDLGQFITGFIAPIVEKVHSVTKPLEPLAEMLTAEIPLLAELKAQQRSLLDIAGTLLGQTKYASVVKAVRAIIQVIELVKTVDAFLQSGEGNLKINFGDFVVGGDARSANNAQAVPTNTPTNMNANAQVPAGAAKNVVSKLGTTPGAWRFPLLTSPAAMFGLLMGKEVTLFEYDLPSLDLQFLYEQSFPIFPGLNAKLGGEVRATTNISFGLTTRGFLEFQASNYDPSKIPLIFLHGFYLSDHGIEKSGNDAPEATVTARITAGASVGIGGLIEVGVEGYIQAQVRFDLKDDPNEGTGIYINNDVKQGYAIPPVYDGKIYLDELVNDLDCIFNIYGDLTVGLDAYFWVGVKIFGAKITIFSARHTFFTATLYDFAYECIDEMPILATLANGTLNLQLAAQNNDGVLKGDRFMVTEAMLPVNGVDTAFVKVSARGSSNYFRKTDVSTITTAGTAYDDEIIIDGTIAANIDLHGGAGNDRLLVSSSAATQSYTRKLWGDGGKDVLIGGDFADELRGGEGNDSLYGMKANDVLFGDGGDDVLVGAQGEDIIWGGAGNDQLFGDDGNDILNAEAGNDTLYGGQGNDRLRGGNDDDTLFGEDGDDSLYGDAGVDALTGAKGIDYLLGGTGIDRIIWTAGDQADAFIDGGDAGGSGTRERDVFEITASALSDNVIFSAVTVTTSIADPNTSGTTLTRTATAVEASINGILLKATDIESIDFKAGAGADNVTVNDLKGSLIADMSFDVGVSSGTTQRVEQATNPILVQPAVVSGALRFDLRGPVTTGDVWSLALGQTSYTYTVLSTDTTLAHVATGLQNAIDAGLLYDATASGLSVFLVKRTAAATLTTALVGKQLAVTGTSGFYRLTDGTASAELAWNADAATIQAALESFASIGAGHVTVSSTKLITLSGVSTVLSVGAPLALSDRDTSGTSISMKDAQGLARTELAYQPATDANGSKRIAASTFSGTEDVAQRIEQSSEVTLSGVVTAGNRWQIGVDGQKYFVDAGTGTNTTLNGIATSLAAKINASATPYKAVADGAKITISTKIGGRSFYLTEAAVYESGITDAARVNNARMASTPAEVLQQFWTTSTATLTGAAPTDSVSTWRVTLGEQEFSYQAVAGASLATIAAALRTAVDAHADFVATGSGAAITVSRADGATFTVEVTKSYLVPMMITIDVPFSGHDAANDVITFNGGQNTVFGNHTNDADSFTVTTQSGSVLVAEVGGPNVTLTNMVRTTTALATGNGEPVFGSTDRIYILGGAGNDSLNASGVIQNLAAIQLKGEAGNDQLTGSVYADVLDGGLGDDNFRGSNGVDIFFDAGGSDTLSESFDLDMSLYGNTFVT